MRVLIVNASEKTGGAAIAASRLKEALINHGVKAKMLVRKKEDDNLSVVGLKGQFRQRLNFLCERLMIWKNNGYRREGLFDIDTGWLGTDITSLPEFQEADIIHLHWVNQGFLSLQNINKILRKGKPIVWTMHDMWPFTGICHYAHDCENYLTVCRNCRLLAHPGEKDLSYRVFKRKEQLLSSSNMVFVACSKWLAEEANKSFLLRGKLIEDIPNPINSRLYYPHDKEKSRQKCRLPLNKKLILFSAYRTTLPIKGLNYLIEACRLCAEAHPETKDQYAIVAVGKDADLIADKFPYPVYSMGYIEDERKMAEIYNACDVFVIPSLQDNLPNTIVEAMSCGVPCVGFKVGGIPQMIDSGVDGFLADARDVVGLQEGIEWVLEKCNYEEVSKTAYAVAMKNYSEHQVALRYIEIYNQLCKKRYE